MGRALQPRWIHLIPLFPQFCQADQRWRLCPSRRSLSLSNFHEWVLKLDHEGSVQWSNTYGGPGSDYFSTKSQTKDGGYILTGNTESFGSSFHSSNGRVLRLDSAGDITWQEAFEGHDIYWAEPTSDNGIILAGT